MILSFLFLAIGFVVLILGADWLVSGASGLAKRLNVPDLVIGLTVVAFGTSMPEFVVNMAAVIDGSSDIALTNILGSNIINVLVILGVSATIYPISSQRSSRRFDIPLSVLAGLMVLLLGTELFGFFGDERTVSRIDGIILLVIFIGFMIVLVRQAIRGENVSDESYTPMVLWKAILLIIAGLVGLVVGGQLVVRCAVKIAAGFGVPEAVIGVTIVALGTSLPELATSAVAALKKNSDLALGNVIGSNIFNVFFVLGTSSLFSPLPAYDNLAIDAAVAGLCCLLVWLFVSTNKENKIKRWHGVTLLLCYAAYLTWLLMTL